MNQFFEKLAGFTMGKTMIVALIVGALFYFTMYDDGSAVDGQIASLNQELTKEEAKKTDTDATLKQVREMQEKVGRLSQQYQEISRRLPSVLYSIDINKTIDGFARGAGVSVKSKKPGETVKKEVVEEVPVDVNLQGTYAQLAQFVYLVSSSERLARVKNISISENEGEVGGKSLRFEGQVVGYKLAPEKSKDTPETKQ